MKDYLKIGSPKPTQAAIDVNLSDAT